MEKLIEAVIEAHQPQRVKEVTIRPYGIEQVEIIIPNVNDDGSAADQEADQPHRHAGIPHPGQQPRPQAAVQPRRRRARGRDRSADSRGGACWAGGCRWPEEGEHGIVRRPGTSSRGSARSGKREGDRGAGGQRRLQRHRRLPDFGVGRLRHRRAAPSISASTARGRPLFGELTGHNLPDEDGELQPQAGHHSRRQACTRPLRSRAGSPTSGEITGDAQTKKEVDATVAVLKAGSLPAALNKEPISEVLVGPTLGRDTIRRAPTP